MGWRFGVIMARTPHFGWKQLEVGDENYPQAHADLVRSIDKTLNEVAENAGGVKGPHSLYIQAQPPDNPTDGDVWIDISG